MKKILTLSALLIAATVTFAQVPLKLSYQAVVRNTSDELVANTTVGIKISILLNSPTGSEVYTETQTASTNENGLLSIVIGNLVTLSIDWSSGTYYIKTQIDPAGGTSYTISGTSQLLSVPYAFYSKSSQDAVKLTGDQTIAGNKTFSGTTTVAAPVNATDAATKAYIDHKFDLLNTAYQEYYDWDGNGYGATLIGDQIWMIYSLYTTSLNDGTVIQYCDDPSTWSTLAVPAYCWYDNNEGSYGRDLGALYNWHAVNSGKLCPVGWHVPTADEWNKLTTYLGGVSVAGGKIKEPGTDWWTAPNTGATGETGFKGRPGGRRDDFGNYLSLNTQAGFWTATSASTDNAHFRALNHTDAAVATGSLPKKQGLSVRCVKD